MVLQDKLDFVLPDFLRISWVSEELKMDWEPRIIQLPQFLDIVFYSDEVLELVPIQIKFIPINELYEFKKQICAKGLFAEHLECIASKYQYAYVKSKAASGLPVIIGKRQNVFNFKQCISGLDKGKKDCILPENTIAQWHQFSGNRLKDLMWTYFDKEENSIGKLRIYENSILNPCWNSLGISGLPFNPFSLDCSESLALANQIKSIAERYMPQDLFKAWYEILSWPTEWSALHGIAEVKTPLFKMIYNTDATATKYTLQFTSESYPEKGLNGLLFPYKKPRKLYFSESGKFKAGLDYLDKSLK